MRSTSEASMHAQDKLTDLKRSLMRGNHPLTKEGSYRVEKRLCLDSILVTTSSGNQEKKSPLMKLRGDT